jgi:hypothetical protein
MEVLILKIVRGALFEHFLQVLILNQLMRDSFGSDQMSPHRDRALAIPHAGWVLLEKEKRSKLPHPIWSFIRR